MDVHETDYGFSGGRYALQHGGTPCWDVEAVPRQHLNKAAVMLAAAMSLWWLGTQLAIVAVLVFQVWWWVTADNIPDNDAIGGTEHTEISRTAWKVAAIGVVILVLWPLLVLLGAVLTTALPSLMPPIGRMFLLFIVAALGYEAYKNYKKG